MAEYSNDKPDGDDKKTDATDILKEAKDDLEAAWEYDRQNREEAIKDLRFLADDQWPQDIREQRQLQGRPCLTVNLLKKVRNQVVNDIRQSNISIKATPVDDDSDPELAELYTGLMRDVQYKSSAQYVFSKAAGDSVGCGIGHFRFLTEYGCGSTFNQDLTIKHIPYPLAVLWDPAAIEPDREDAMHCFVLEFIPTRTFKARFPKAKEVDIQVPSDEMGSHGLWWATKDGVLLAEAWYKRKVKKKIAAYEDGSVIDTSEFTPEQLKMLPEPIQEREVDGYKVEHCLFSGSEILEGPTEWGGRFIPIIPVIGDEVHLEKSVIRSGLIRSARDPQQLYNYWRSAAAELIALAPKSKWLVTSKQIAEHRQEWNDANVSPKAFLTYTPDSNAATPAPTRVAPPEPPTALWQEAALASEDIKGATGLYDASLGAKSNETSGVAIEKRQREGDVSTYHFADNLNRSLQHAGRVMIDLIPVVYDTERVVRIMNDDDEHEFPKINLTVMGDNGEPMMVNDLSAGEFDVRVELGPSYTTQRLEAADIMMQYAQADPQALPFIRDQIVKNMDWAGAQEMSERLKRTIPPQVLGPDEQQEQLPPPPPNPQEEMANQLAMRNAGAKVAEQEGKARKVHADADKVEIENAVTEHQVAGFGIPPPDHALPPEPPPTQQ